jgi:hypothetical protein
MDPGTQGMESKGQKKEAGNPCGHSTRLNAKNLKAYDIDQTNAIVHGVYLNYLLYEKKNKVDKKTRRQVQTKEELQSIGEKLRCMGCLCLNHDGGSRCDRSHDVHHASIPDLFGISAKVACEHHEYAWNSPKDNGTHEVS